MYCQIIFLSICVSMFTGCSPAMDNISLTWRVIGYLPEKNGEPHVGVAGAISGIVQDKLLVAGGANFPEGMPWEGGKKVYQHDVYLYDIREDMLALFKTSTLDESIAYSANTSAEGLLYVAGGERDSGAVDEVKLLSLQDDSLIIQELPSLPVPLTNGGLVHLEGRLYFVGGENAELVSDKIYTLDLRSDTVGWVEYLKLPYALSHAIVAADQNKNIYIAGGRKRNLQSISAMYDAVLKIDLSHKSMDRIAVLPKPLAAGTGVWLEDQLIIMGGDDARTFHKVEALLAEASKLQHEKERELVLARKDSILSTHPGFSKSVWALNLSQSSWQRLNDFSGQSAVTTTAFCHGGDIFVPSGEVKAGVRTNEILRGRFGRK